METKKRSRVERDEISISMLVDKDYRPIRGSAVMFDHCGTATLPALEAFIILERYPTTVYGGVKIMETRVWDVGNWSETGQRSTVVSYMDTSTSSTHFSVSKQHDVYHDESQINCLIMWEFTPQMIITKTLGNVYVIIFTRAKDDAEAPKVTVFLKRRGSLFALPLANVGVLLTVVG